MKPGEHIWDTETELRTRCHLTMRLGEGYLCFTNGKTPLAAATLMPDGKTLDITIWAHRVAKVVHDVKKGG